MSILRGGLGIVVMLAILFALSRDRSHINWRLVGGGILLQLPLGLLVLTPLVQAASLQ